MSSSITYNIDGLNAFGSSLFAALCGRGEEGDAQAWVKFQAGKLAQEIAGQVGPRSQSKAAKAIGRQVTSHITVKPEIVNLGGVAGVKYPDLVWLSAGHNFICGLHKADDQTNASGADILRQFRLTQNLHREEAYTKVGVRGKTADHQNVSILNRTRVSKAAMKYVMDTIKYNIGLLKASFAYTASNLLGVVPGLPAFVTRHTATGAQGRAIYDASGMVNAVSPTMIFGSSSIGVESNEVVVRAINSAIIKRQMIAESSLQKVIDGYAFDWNTGATFRPRKDLTYADN
jgi:hypothetical protein